MTRLILIAAGGHGREVADVLRDQRSAGHDVELVGFVDDDLAKKGSLVGGLPVLGDLSVLASFDPAETRVVCCTGLPHINRSLAARASVYGLSFANVISPRAYVSPSARLGTGVVLFPGAVAMPDTVLGDHVLLSLGATVSHDSTVGAYSVLYPGVHIAGGSTVGEGCLIGMGASVVQLVRLGDDCRVGAGAAVLEDVPPGTTVVGVPARAVSASRSDQKMA